MTSVHLPCNGHIRHALFVVILDAIAVAVNEDFTDNRRLPSEDALVDDQLVTGDRELMLPVLLLPQTKAALVTSWRRTCAADLYTVAQLELIAGFQIAQLPNQSLILLHCRVPRFSARSGLVRFR